MGFSGVFRIMVFISCLACSLTAAAQQAIWSAPEKTSSRTLETEIIGENKDGLFLVSKNPKDASNNITIERYSSSLRQMATREYIQDKNDYYAGLALRSHELQLFYARIDKDEEQIHLKASRLKFILSPVDNDTTLFTISDKSNKDFLQIFKFIANDNILFLYTEEKVDAPSVIHYLEVDTLLKAVRKGTFNVNISEPYEIEEAILVDGNIALLAKEEVKKKVSKQGYRYHLLYGQLRKNITLTKHELFDDSIGVTDGILKADTLNDAIYFAGLYNAKDSGYAKGYYIWKKNLINDSVGHVISTFSQNVINNLSGRTSKIKGLSNLRMGNIILRYDGGIVITAEEFQQSREAMIDMNVYGGTNSTFRYYYYFENILILSINPTGQPDWHSVIRKEQVSVNDNGIYSSYLLIPLADRLVYLYNDLSRRSVNLTSQAVNTEGSTRHEILVRGQDFKGRLIPRNGKQVSYNELVIPGYTRKGRVLLKLQY